MFPLSRFHRREYQQLSAMRKELPGVPILALTATATPAVQQEIVKNLGMSANCARYVIITSFRIASVYVRPSKCVQTTPEYNALMHLAPFHYKKR